MAEVTTGDKFAAPRVVQDGIVYLNVDGGLKPVGTVAEVDGPALLARIAAGKAEVADLEGRVGQAREVLASGPAQVEAARLLSGKVASLAAELSSSESRTAEFNARAAAGRERVARIRGGAR